MSQGIEFYSLLGVDFEASSSQIRAAYFRLAKELHPDRRAGDDPEATERFLAVQTAYEVLMDPVSREEYDRQRITGGVTTTTATADRPSDAKKLRPFGPRGPSIEEARDARRAFDAANQLLESGQTQRAMRAMQVVVRTVPDRPEYLSLLGYLMAREGEKLHAARDYCRLSVEAEPYEPEFHARLGYVYLRAGLNNTAQQCFEQALQLDATNALAREHGNGKRSTDNGGLMGSILKLLGSRN